MTSIFDPIRLGAVSLDVMACGREAPHALAARQKTRLALQLKAAVRGSRFYRERLSGMSPEATPLSDLPVVTRNELMARFDDWVTDPQLKLAELQAFTLDSRRIGEPYLGKYLIWESSGTSNEPGIFVQDAQTLAVYDALEALRRSAPRPMQRWFDPMLLAERIAFVGAISGHFSSIVTMRRLRQVNPLMSQRLNCFSILQSTKALVEEMNAYAPTVIATYPTVAALLAEECRLGLLKFKPKEIWTGGETLTTTARQLVEQVLGCAVRNSYGASEFMSIGWECSHGNLHVNSDWVILEPVDEQGRPVPLDQPCCTTLLTNLANHVQPLIRYDMGDQVTVLSGRCGCGSSLPVIEVQGRRDDPLVMAGCDGQPVTLLPLALTTVLEDEAGVFDFQLCQRDDRTLVLGLMVSGAEAEIAAERCRVTLGNFALTQGLAPIHLIVELGQVASRGRSGKAKRIVAQ
jgi:phenylacetate-coenzyme A ligase PaaK-like adenylate-forming protein